MMINRLFENKISAYRTFLQFSNESQYFIKKFIEYINSKNIYFESQNIHTSIIFPSKKSEFETLIHMLGEFIKLDKNFENTLKNLQIEGLDLIFNKESVLNESNLSPHIKHNIEALKIREIENHEIKFNVLSKTPEVNKYKELIETIKNRYKCPISKLSPNFSPNFYEEMISSLIKHDLISKINLDKNAIYQWVQNAFFFEKKNITQINENLNKLNWKDSTTLFANWMFFLKRKLVTYNDEDNKQFNDWMCMHFTIKNKPIIKGEKDFNTLKKYLIDFNKKIKSNYFSIINENVFDYNAKNANVKKAHEIETI